MNMFGDEAWLASLEKQAERERPMLEGETHRLSLLFSDGDAPSAKIECLELEDPERPCAVKNHGEPIPGTCVLQELYANVGWDAVNILLNGKPLSSGSEFAVLKLDLPVGYQYEGSGEDYEDWFVVHIKEPE